MNISKSIYSYIVAAFIAIGISVPQSSAQMSVTQMGFGNFKKQIYSYWYKKGWFIDAQSGVRILGSTSAGASLSPGLNVNGAIGYRFSERFALKGRLGYNSFGFEPASVSPDWAMVGAVDTYESRGTSVSTSFEAMINLITVKNRVSNRSLKGNRAYKLDIHAGIGWTSYANSPFKTYVTDVWGDDAFRLDPLVRGNDDMGHVIVGLTNSYDLNSRISLNLDASGFILIAQDYTFDSYNVVKHEGIGFISTISFGLTYRFL